MDKFDRTSKTIKTIYEDFVSGHLIVDPSYQRRRVWSIQDKIRLIETILMHYIIPEVFFWPASIDPDTGDSITHIVDGQQRIDAIIDFISGKFSLSRKYLISSDIKDTFGDKSFRELPSDVKSEFWTYRLSVVEIDKSWTKEQIMTMFYRLNLTNYSLNEQEKRNSKISVFGDKSEALSRLDFWDEYRVFSAADARRMKDTEFCCSIFILAKEGIIDQTNSKRINYYYDDYSDAFDEDDILYNRITNAMEIIRAITDETSKSFASKKAQMYTLFCLAFRILDENIKELEPLFEKIKQFVIAYNLFRNEYDLKFDSPELSELYESIKKYKLASSEGINKYQNRVIRYEELYKTCISSDARIIELFKELIEELSSKKGDTSKVKEESEKEEAD